MSTAAAFDALSDEILPRIGIDTRRRNDSGSIRNRRQILRRVHAYVGRRKFDDVELSDEEKPENAHNAPAFGI